jgi:hypothetical protein
MFLRRTDLLIVSCVSCGSFLCLLVWFLVLLMLYRVIRREGVCHSLIDICHNRLLIIALFEWISNNENEYVLCWQTIIVNAITIPFMLGNYTMNDLCCD